MGPNGAFFYCCLLSLELGGCIRCVTPGVEKGGSLFSEFSSAHWTVVLLTFREGKEIYFKVLSNSTIMKKCASVRFVTFPFVLCERDFVSTCM